MLSQAYRNNEYSVAKHLDSIEDVGIRELLGSMLERNPANRKCAEIYLAQARGTVFPEYFYSFLQSYMLIFSAAPILSPDEKINRLKKDIGNIISIFKAEETERIKMNQKNGQCESNVESTKEDSGQSEENTVIETDSDQSFDKSELNQVDQKTSSIPDTGCDIATEQNLQSKQSQAAGKNSTEIDKKTITPAEILEGLVIVTQLVTSCIRGLHHSQSKLQSLEILLELAENTSDETILDRILPYIVSIYLSRYRTLRKMAYSIQTIVSL